MRLFVVLSPFVLALPALAQPVLITAATLTTQQGGQLSGQWRKRSESGAFIAIAEGFGGRFSGTATPTLRIDPTECEDAGEYDCLVVDTCGTFPSRPAVIIVDPIADYNDDNGVDSDDVIFFFGRWDLGC